MRVEFTKLNYKPPPLRACNVLLNFHINIDSQTLQKLLTLTMLNSITYTLYIYIYMPNTIIPEKPIISL